MSLLELINAKKEAANIQKIEDPMNNVTGALVDKSIFVRSADVKESASFDVLLQVICLDEFIGKNQKNSFRHSWLLVLGRFIFFVTWGPVDFPGKNIGSILLRLFSRKYHRSINRSNCFHWRSVG